MKKVYVLILLNLLLINLYGQDFKWTNREGLWAYDYGYGIATDIAGNVYVAGKYEMNANFSGTILSDYGNHNIYVAQYSPSGILNWIRTAGGIYGDYAKALYCDGSSVYIAGEIEGYGNSITFENSPVTITCIGDNDMFLAKYDLDGNLLWAVSGGGYYSDKALGITADKNGNVYVCGFFTNTAIFSGTTIYGNGNKEIFIAKYDMNGNFIWIRQAGGPGRDEAKAIKCDALGNIYITGMYEDGTQYESFILASPLDYFNIFLAKYDPDGNLAWVKTAGGNYDDVAWSLTVDDANKIYIAGEFNASAYFDTIKLITTGSANIFVACYEDTGTALWAASAGGPLIDRARGIGCDGTNLYITGQFSMSANFGSFSLNGTDSSEIFIARLNNEGDFEWATAVGGPPDSVENLSYESGNSIYAEKTGNVYVTGTLLNGGIFGSTAIAPYSRSDVFITKLTAGLGVSVVENNKPEISIYPNPGSGNFTINLKFPDLHKKQISATNCLGQLIYKKTVESSSQLNIDLSAYKKGIYFIEIKTEDHAILREKIFIQ